MSKFRVAISADFVKSDGKPAFPDFDLSALDDSRIEWAYVTAVDGVMQAADMAEYDALILLAAQFEQASLPDNGRLAMVARFGVGYDNVDVTACTNNSVAVVITPDGVRRPVATTILTLILALSHRLFDKAQLGRSGAEGWGQKADYMGYGIVGQTLGSLGIGNIGAEMFRLAAPLDMQFIAHDPYADPAIAQELGIRLVELDELFSQADYLCVNCPLTDTTERIVNAQRLASMKPTAFLINTARGPIVDQAALYQALKNNTIRGAALDVLEREPPTAEDSPLLQLDNVIITPHALCWTNQCFAGIGRADTTAVLDLLSGANPVGVVNREILETPAWQDRLASYRSQFKV
jgi:phosphoglycerate dehydrogenase-like enzyme